MITIHNPPDGRAELEQLADALTQRGYDATLIVPAPCLAVRIPGATIPQMIYNTGGQFWWHTSQSIAPARQAALAADAITWALRTQPRQPPTHDATAPLASTTPSPPTTPHSSGGGQEC
ncbi:MAG TPA: hypothetical protein VGI74_16115 [Streptosporangiaceae bacterium]